MEELKKEWREEFREYFDKTLKPKKPTMANLDRELMVDFISKLLAKQQEEFVKKVKGMLMDDSNHDDYYYGYNDALNDLLEDFADIKSKLV